MTSSTEPEVHNVLQSRQRRTEPRPRVSRAENLGKFGLAIYEICKGTNRQTDSQTNRSQYFAPCRRWSEYLQCMWEMSYISDDVGWRSIC